MKGPPELEDLPERQERTTVGGPPVEKFSLPLRSTTPILGGAPRTRSVDDVDYIRVPAIRGQLRFWWRALHGHNYYGDAGKGEALFEAEGELWGMAAREEQKRSAVEITVDVDRATVRDEYTDFDYNRDGFYALWPAQSQDNGRVEPAPRRLPGVEFELHVRAPECRMDEVKRATRSWLLFGGYGSRTRRGLGSVTVREDENDWLPKECSLEALKKKIGDDLLIPSERAAPPFPVLRGARLMTGSVCSDGRTAWLEALHWLEDFRQEAASENAAGDNEDLYARQYKDANFPVGLSNWPEPDKLRHLYNQHSEGHSPERHNDTPVWPRAGFGLPIIGQFKDHGDPGDYEVAWFDEGGNYMRRMASPLIVTPLPLTEGRHVPVALWLDRAYPEGKVGIAHNESPESGSIADFDELVAEGDEAEFKPLTRGQDSPKGERLRNAFFWWLDEHGKASEVHQ